VTDDRRQQVLLGILVVLLLVVGWKQAGRFFGGDGRSRAVLAATRGGGGGQALEEVVELRLDDLDRERGKYEPGRNLFEYGPAPRPERPLQDKPKLDLPVKPQPKPPPNPAVDQLRLPPIDLVYLGNFGPAGRRIAVFSDGEEILNAMIGDVLKEKFEVVGIGYESADLGYVDFPESLPARLAVGG